MEEEGGRGGRGGGGVAAAWADYGEGYAGGVDGMGGVRGRHQAQGRPAPDGAGDVVCGVGWSEGEA